MKQATVRAVTQEERQIAAMMADAEAQTGISASELAAECVTSFLRRYPENPEYQKIAQRLGVLRASS